MCQTGPLTTIVKHCTLLKKCYRYVATIFGGSTEKKWNKARGALLVHSLILIWEIWNWLPTLKIHTAILILLLRSYYNRNISSKFFALMQFSGVGNIFPKIIFHEVSFLAGNFLWRLFPEVIFKGNFPFRIVKAMCWWQFEWNQSL